MCRTWFHITCANMFLLKSSHSSKLLIFKSHLTSCIPKLPPYTHTYTHTLYPLFWTVCSIHNPYQNLTWTNERKWGRSFSANPFPYRCIITYWIAARLILREGKMSLCLLIYGSSCNLLILPLRQLQQHQQARPALQMRNAVRKRGREKPRRWEQI